MNWVAIDLGISNIKASVLDKTNKPVRLTYTMGDYSTTLLSSIAVTDDGNILVGDYASLLGISNPNMMVNNWGQCPDKERIARTIFETIQSAAIMHYNEQEIGAVLIYNDIEDLRLKAIAASVFSEVKSMQLGDVIKRVIAPDANLLLIADFGESAFRVTVQDPSKCLFYTSNDALGFSSFDMLSLIDFDDTASHNSVEIALLGQMMQRIKVLMNNGDDVTLPNVLNTKRNSIRTCFEQKMTTFLYQCFEECTSALKSSSKKWDDVDDVVFIGGGAHSSIVDVVFEKYRHLKSYNSKIEDFDAQYAASNCAIQIPHRTNTGVVIKF